MFSVAITYYEGYISHHRIWTLAILNIMVIIVSELYSFGQEKKYI